MCTDLVADVYKKYNIVIIRYLKSVFASITDKFVSFFIAVGNFFAILEPFDRNFGLIQFACECNFLLFNASDVLQWCLNYQWGF